jgi:hypothetical protein
MDRAVQLPNDRGHARQLISPCQPAKTGQKLRQPAEALDAVMEVPESVAHSQLLGCGVQIEVTKATLSRGLGDIHYFDQAVTVPRLDRGLEASTKGASVVVKQRQPSRTRVHQVHLQSIPV